MEASQSTAFDKISVSKQKTSAQSRLGEHGACKSFYKNDDPFSKNGQKTYVFNPFLKSIKDQVACANLMVVSSTA